MSSALLRRADRAAHADEIRRLTRRLETQKAEAHEILLAERALADRFPDPLLVLGAGYAVTRANAAARMTYGSALSAALRQPGLRAAVDRAQTEMRDQRAELTMPVPVGREVLATVIPLATSLTDGGRIIVLLSDRTREKAVERMRADFVANASHELRTPLASLMGFIETLRGPAADDPPAQRRFLPIMAEQALRMNRLIDELLGLSRIEMSEHQPPTERVDLAALVHRVARLSEAQLVQAGVSLTLDLPQVTPAIVGDEDQLVQVLQNLLDNAVKYGKRNGNICITIAVPGADRHWGSQPGLLLQVIDDGQGIPRVHLPRLTERFYRISGRAREVLGTGLGLAIVKHIVNRHRGILEIDSIEGDGTTVTVWLPVAETGNAEADEP